MPQDRDDYEEPPPPSSAASSRSRPRASASTSASTSAGASASQRSSSDVSSTMANVGVRHRQHRPELLSPNVVTTCGLAYVRSPHLGGGGNRPDHHRKRPLPRLPPPNAATPQVQGNDRREQQMRGISLASRGVSQMQPSAVGIGSPAAAGDATAAAIMMRSSSGMSSMEDGMPPPPSLFASTGPRRARGSGGARTQGGVGTKSGDMYLRSGAPGDPHPQNISRSASCDGSIASSSACSSTIPPLGERSYMAANGAGIWKSSTTEEHDAAIGSTIGVSANAANADVAHRRIAGASSFDSLASTTSDLLRTTGQVAAGAWAKGSPHVARLGSAATTAISRTLSREDDLLPAPTNSPRRGFPEVGSRWGHAAGAMISRTLSREEDFVDLKDQSTRIPATSPRRAFGEVGGRLGHAAVSVISRTLSREDDYEYNMRLPRHGGGPKVGSSQCEAEDDDHFSSTVLYRWEDCIFVRAEGGRPGTLMITSTHLIFEFDEDDEEPEYLRRSRHRFISESDYISGFTEGRGNDDSSTLRTDGLMTRRGSNDSNDSLTGACRHPSTPTSSAGGTSNTKSSTLDDSGDFDGDDNSYCSETYQEDMSKTLIRAVEEEARRRLQELDEGGEGDATSAVGSVASSTASLFFARRQVSGRWNSGSARLYHDEDSESGISAFDEDRLIAWRRQAETQVAAPDMAPKMDGSVNESNTCTNTVVEDDGDQGQDWLDFYALDPQRARYRGLKWRLSSLGEVYSRVFMMRDVAFELFAKAMDSVRLSDAGRVPIGDLSNQSCYIAVPPVRHASLHQSSRRDDVVGKLKTFDKACGLNFAYWHAISSSNPTVGRGRLTKILKGKSLSNSGIDGRALESLHALTRAWRKGGVSNFCYLSRLNAIAGRSLHDPSSYPVFPWVLCNYTSNALPDLSCEKNYRDLSKPMGALTAERLEKFMGKYHSLCNSIDSPIPAFMYGSHYSSTGGVPLHFLVRQRPFAGLHRQLQGGSFDLPDRLFRSVAMAYDLCSRSSSTDVKELTPEFYSNPTFLVNSNGFDLGVCASGETVNDVILPPWANGSPQKFVDVMRDALESDICSKMLPSWIDLIFGTSSRGSEARKSYNVFYHLTYIEPGDLEKIVDEELRTETELHIADFGRCPQKLFYRPHPRKAHLARHTSLSS